MRQIKYIKPIFIIILLTLWGFSLHYFESYAIYSLAIMIVLDILFQITVNFWFKKKIKKREFIHFGKQNIVERINIIIFLIVMVGYFVISKNFDSTKINMNILSMIGITYFAFAELVFSKYFQGFILDKSGVVQPEFYNKSYYWKEVDDINIYDTEINFTINSKVYKSIISKYQMSEITTFLKANGINYIA